MLLPFLTYREARRFFIHSPETAFRKTEYTACIPTAVFYDQSAVLFIQIIAGIINCTDLDEFISRRSLYFETREANFSGGIEIEYSIKLRWNYRNACFF